MLSYDSPAAVPRQDTSSAAATLKSCSLTPASTATTTVDSQVSMMSSTDTASASAEASKHHHILLVTGPAGCGKTTVAEHIAQQLGMPYIEGDSYHTEVNVEKMRTGTPLTDADRWDWLAILRDESIKRINNGAPGVVVTCSALKRKYRDVIRVAAYHDHSILTNFIFLDAAEEVLLKRVGQRQGHYMGANMVASQFSILERPTPDEKDVVSIDVSCSLEQVMSEALERAKLMVQQGRE